MSGFSEWIDTLRYDHPGVFRLGLAVVVTMTLFICFMFLPDSPMFRAMGVTGLQTKISAASNGTYWSARAAFNNTGDGDHVQLFGNVEGIDETSSLIAVLPSDGKWLRKKFSLANTEITDLYGAAAEVGALRMENARFDIYANEKVVVWIHNAPLNVKLIETGVARPDPKPPTNIFDLAFATYYWRIVKGGE